MLRAQVTLSLIGNQHSRLRNEHEPRQTCLCRPKSYDASLWVRAVTDWVSVAWTLVSLRPASLKYCLHFLFVSSLELGTKGET